MSAYDTLIHYLNALDEESVDYPCGLFEFETEQLIGYLRQRIEETHNINVTNDMSLTLLILASATGLIDLVVLLINAGADLDKQDSLGFSALMWACLRQETEIVSLLISAGANLFLRSGEETVLVLNARYVGDTDIADKLIDASLLQDKNQNLEKVLVRVSEGPCELLFYPSDNNIRINSALLHTLSSRLWYEPANMIRLLINKPGFNVKNHKEGGIGDVILHHAISKGYKDIVTDLIQKGVDIHYVGNRDTTPLMLAVSLNQNEIVKQLLEAGANVSVRLGLKRTALALAIKNKNSDGISLLRNAYKQSKTCNFVDKIYIYLLKISPFTE
jgi:ankyrin repeat protein